MTASTRPEPGVRLGSYEIVRSLDAGGMAAVYEARHTALGKRVAIKLLHDHVAENSVAAARFVREGRAASAIRHPNVVEMFEVGVHAGSAYLVMELLEGQDLATYLRAHGRLSGTEAVDIVLPTASAVAAAHAAGVIHRDLKPSNLFLARDGRMKPMPKVVDFGISKMPHDERERVLTETGTLLGTVDYMAPEQARSARNAGERSDQYALGVILYECVTGRRPFSGKSTYGLLHAIVTAPFATPRSIVGDIDPGLEAVILRAMNRDPAGRFPSVKSFGCALLPFASPKLAASWRADFEASASRDVADVRSDGPPPGEADAERYVLFHERTVQEDSVLERRKHSLKRRGVALAAFVTVIAAVAAISVLRARVPAASERTRTQAETPGREASIPFQTRPRLAEDGSTRTVPSFATSVSDRATAAHAPPTLRSRQPSLGSPPARSIAGVSSTSPLPSEQAPLPSVERGYNRAPIVE